LLNGLKAKYVEWKREKLYKGYVEEVGRQRDRYGMWIAAMEKDSEGQLVKAGSSLQKQGTYAGVSYELFAFSELEKIEESTADILIFVSEDGVPSKKAADKIVQSFLEDGSISFVYADEDSVCEDGKRGYPWFKPEYSPDTLLSFFYIGNIFAVKRNEAVALLPLKKGDGAEKVYDFVLRYISALGEPGKAAFRICHITEVLFHKYRKDLKTPYEKEWVSFAEGEETGFEAEFNGIKSEYLKQKGKDAVFENTKNVKDEEIGCQRVRYLLKETPLVTVVIPSKDHPDILKRCIDSMREKTTYENYEILVIDNGSKEENKTVLEEMAGEKQFYYHYEPMEFNFSRMCNIGVSLAKGEYILLLNDDVEIMQNDWMEVMLGQAMQSHTGAVGAKLLYPDSDLIQHVGITNMAVGPSHKLIGLSDGEDYYYGRNRVSYNMIGVTAACLMIRKAIYETVGGFSEEIKVAYNDADFCMKVREAGFYNVVRNDVILFHHESLSRGDDRLNDDKLNRLLVEKEIVRKNHTVFMESDPFYNPNLAGYRVNYDCSFRYGYEKREIGNSYGKRSKQDFGQWENNCLTIRMEHAGLEAKTDCRDMTEIILIEGWSYILGMDNCRYKRYIVLQGEDGESVIYPVTDRYRKDVAAILPNETNVDLAGFVVRIPKEALKSGKWNIGMLAKDGCSRQRLYKSCDTVLEIQ